MSTRTAITLDDGVLEQVRRVSRSMGVSFPGAKWPGAPRLAGKRAAMGVRTGPRYDNLETLLELGEGEMHR